MDLPVGGLAEQGFVLGSLAVAVVDGQGVVTGWSPQAAACWTGPPPASAVTPSRTSTSRRRARRDQAGSSRRPAG